MNNPINILLADDHQIVRNGVKLMLEHQNAFIPCITEATNGQEALDLASEKQFDIFLLDLNMPVLDGISTLKKLKQMDSNVRVIIFTMHNEEHYIDRAIKSGALGYVLKNSGLDELIQAVLTVFRFETFYCKEIEKKAREIEVNILGSPDESI